VGLTVGLKAKLLAVALAAMASVANQYWVGGATIYSADLADRRARLHQAILTNRLPPGEESWSGMGGNGTNLRAATVRVAAAVQAATGWSLTRVYAVQDTVALFLALLLVFALLEAVAGSGLALVGLLYVAAVLPLTYFVHYFHPWDRPSLMMWVLALLLLRRRWWVPLAAALAVGVLIKPDIIIFPLLVFLVEVDVRRPVRALVVAGLLAVVTFGVYAALRSAYGGSADPVPMAVQVSRNLRDLVSLGAAYPPLLALSLPVALGIAGYRRADRFGRSAVLFAGFFATILILRSNFVEVRAHMPLLVLLGPAALVGVQSLILPPTAGTRER
jgi:hypothetical protein